MPQVRKFPQATGLQPGDALLIDRPGVGTMYVNAADIPLPIYDVAMGYPGSPPSNSTVLVFNVVRPIYLPEDLPGSEFSASVPPDAPVALNIQKNGTIIGTINFSNNGSVGTATFLNPVNFNPGDELRITTPATLGGMSTVAATFCFTPGAHP